MLDSYQCEALKEVLCLCRVIDLHVYSLNDRASIGDAALNLLISLMNKFPLAFDRFMIGISE